MVPFVRDVVAEAVAPLAARERLARAASRSSLRGPSPLDLRALPSAFGGGLSSVADLLCPSGDFALGRRDRAHRQRSGVGQQVIGQGAPSRVSFYAKAR